MYSFLATVHAHSKCDLSKYDVADKILFLYHLWIVGLSVTKQVFTPLLIYFCLPVLCQDNPSEFLYFFDTSRRRTCYVAPERFVHSSSLASEGDLGFNVVRTGDLTPAMDIFSAG